MKKRTIILITLLLISSLAVGILGLCLDRMLLKPLGIDRQEHPIALPFVLLEDEILQARIEEALYLRQNPPTEPPTEPPATQPPTQAPTEAPTLASTEPPVVIDDSWFDDALFIGESRIQGMQAFSRMGSADYFCAPSMTVYGVLDARLSDDTFEKATLDQLLKERTYGKVLIHLGINEIPVGAEGILKGYQKIIERVRTLEPDAVIILLGCMSITEDYAGKMKFNIATIHSLNEKLRELAEAEPEIYRYVDTNAWAAGEDGFLKPELTFDGCHLHGELYVLWCDFIREQITAWPDSRGD